MIDQWQFPFRSTERQNGWAFVTDIMRGEDDFTLNVDRRGVEARCNFTDVTFQAAKISRLYIVVGNHRKARLVISYRKGVGGGPPPKMTFLYFYPY